MKKIVENSRTRDENVKAVENRADQKERRVKDDKQEQQIAKVVLSRSIDELSSCGFVYNDFSEEVMCTVCCPETESKEETVSNSTFKYEILNGLKFPKDAKLPRQFVNLKRSIKRHIEESKTHPRLSG